MSKKTSGIDDLVNTLIKQHGLMKSLAIAHEQLSTNLNEQREFIWTCTLMKLHRIRGLTH